MATASWLDPTTRQARLMKKRDLQAMPEMVHKMEERLFLITESLMIRVQILIPSLSQVLFLHSTKQSGLLPV